MVTLAAFPAVISRIKSKHGDSTEWTGIFNVILKSTLNPGSQHVMRSYDKTGTSVNYLLKLTASLCAFYCISVRYGPTQDHQHSTANICNFNLTSVLGKFFTPVVCFLVFNVGDFCGRVIAGFIQKVCTCNVTMTMHCLKTVPKFTVTT